MPSTAASKPREIYATQRAGDPADPDSDDRLVSEEAERSSGEGVAVVTLVYDHHARELAARLIDMQHHHHELVVSSLHVHLGERHCLEVSILRGPMDKLRHLAEEMLATKGVLHGDVRYTSSEGSFNRWH